MLESHERARLGIGYIPQGREVFSRMTVWENLKVGEMLQQPGEGVDYERVYEFFLSCASGLISVPAPSVAGSSNSLLSAGRWWASRS